jgi:3',5'-cyclic AMP phosphodiesterase CpdA
MMGTTVIQISDSHLSRRHGYFVANWRRVLERVRKDQPDQVINTGDVSLNGANDDEDLLFAASQHRRLPVGWRALPGNHDVGEEPGAAIVGHPVDSVRQARWRRAFGPDRWSVTIGGWRLLGINCFLYGSGLSDEDAQHQWLGRQIGEADGPVGLFLHKPLFLDNPAEETKPTHTVSAVGREALLTLIAGSAVRFVASGHLHQHRRARWGDIELLWGPSCAFPLGSTDGGRPELGWRRFELDGDDFAVTAVELPELERHDLKELLGDGHRFLYQTPAAPPDPADLLDEPAEAG